jgi:His-Xaa-Ser system protein HxsD
MFILATTCTARFAVRSTVSAELTLEFLVEGHSLDAIQRAAYRLVDQLDVESDRDGDVYRCVLRPHAGDHVADDVVAEFRAEVLDQVLRERIRAETADVRNAVLALAFSSLQPLASDQLDPG